MNVNALDSRCCVNGFVMRRWILLQILALSVLWQTHASAQGFVWTRQIQMSGLPTGYGVSADSSGNVYVTGGFEGTANFGPTLLTNAGGNDIFLAKYDANGGLIWAKRAGGSGSDAGADVTTDTSGDVYLTGYFQGPATFDSTNLTAMGSYLFVAKYSPAGDLIWIRQGSGGVGTGIAVDVSGNIFNTGSGIIQKRDPSGNVIWHRELSGLGKSIKVDTNGFVYVAGQFASFNLLTKLDPSGNFLWTQQAVAGTTNADGFPLAGTISAESLALDPAGNPLIAGYFTRTATFGNTNISTPYPTDGGQSSGYVAKYDAAGNFSWVQRVGPRGVASGVVVDSHGGAYVTGTATPSDVFVNKFDSNGNYSWGILPSHTHTQYSGGYGAAVDSSNRAYLVTWTSGGTISFDSASFTNMAGGDIFVSQISEQIAPIITYQPMSSPFGLLAGGEYTFSINTRSVYPVSYQWLFGGTNVAGATNASLTITNVQLANQGDYFVIASNDFGATTSSVVNLTVYFTLTVIIAGSGSVTNNPPGQAQAYYPSDSLVTLTAITNLGFAFTGWSGDATGMDNPLLVGMNTDKYIIASFADSSTNIVIDNIDNRASFTGDWRTDSRAGDYGNNYRDASGSLSATAIATYRPLITVPGFYDISIWYPPRLGSANAPYTISYSGGSFTTNVDQRFNGGKWVLIAPGAYFATGTNGYVSLSNATGESSSVRVVADAVRFVLSTPPVIITQPQSQTVKCGTNVTLKVVVTGTPPLSYQWRFNETNIPGATASNLMILQVQPSKAGNYSVNITNVVAPITSSNAILAVTAPASPWFTPASIHSGGGQFQMTLSGDSGVTFTIETSTNLTHWVARTNILVLSGTAQFSDALDTNDLARFYRAKWFPQ